MKEQKLIIDRLKELTKDQIAKETGATKVANVRFRLFIILFSVIIIVFISIIIMSMFLPCIKQYLTEIPLTVAFLVLIINNFVLKKCTNCNWSYLQTKDKKILDVYEYRQQAVHSFLLKEGYISEGKNNEYFYSALKNSIKDNIKPRLNLSLEPHILLLGIALSIMNLIINDIDGLINKIMSIIILLLIYSVLSLLYYVPKLIKRIMNRDYYDDLNTILDSLMVKDAAKYNKTEEQIMTFIMKWMEKNTK